MAVKKHTCRRRGERSDDHCVPCAVWYRRQPAASNFRYFDRAPRHCRGAFFSFFCPRPSFTVPQQANVQKNASLTSVAHSRPQIGARQLDWRRPSGWKRNDRLFAGRRGVVSPGFDACGETRSFAFASLDSGLVQGEPIGSIKLLTSMRTRRGRVSSRLRLPLLLWGLSQMPRTTRRAPDAGGRVEGRWRMAK